MVLSHEWMQITSLYGGPLEFLFVVESTEDPAYHAVSLLISDFKVYMISWILYACLFVVILRRNTQHLLWLDT